MLGERITICHAGDKISEPAGAGHCIAIPSPIQADWNAGRIIGVAHEKIDNDALGVMHDADDARMTIHVGIKKSLDGLIGRRHGRREGYDRFIGAAHVLGGARGLCTQPAVALRN